MQYLLRALLLCILLIDTIDAISLEKKYPSYTYVFNEFDVDVSYIYNDKFIDFVKKHEKGMKKFYTRSLVRGEAILPTMQGLLVGDGVSDLFIYLSMVESGFSSDAVSPKKAVGLWQFMPATAKHYNLTVCNNYDERCDTVSATSAAINYLNKLHKQFGKWYLAAMAYNCGEGCVKKAIKRAGSDELEILIDEQTKYVPKETRAYIKKILLVAMIGENMTLGLVESDAPSIIEVEVDGGTKLKTIADLIKMDVNTLLQLNIGVKNGVLPSVKQKYKITIPLDKMYAFYLRYETKEVQKIDKSYMLTYSVKLGDTLEAIAKMYDTEVEVIQEVNHLDNEALTLGSLLVIPVSKEKFENVSQ